MGNIPQQLLLGTDKSYLTTYIHKIEEQYFLKQIITHSALHQEDTLTKIHKYKKYDCANLLRIVDSHIVESHNLCSIMTSIYVIMEKPSLSLQRYVEQKHQSGEQLSDEDIIHILTDCLRAFKYLCAQDNEICVLKKQHIYLQIQQSKIKNVKLINPFLVDIQNPPHFNLQQGAIFDLGCILKSQIHESIHSPETIYYVNKMAEQNITFQELQEKFLASNRPTDKKKTKIRLSLTNLLKEQPKNANKHRSRDSLVSINSGSSLQIDYGYEQDLMLHDFYEQINSSLSNITIKSLDDSYNETNQSQNLNSHLFPKKYLNRSRNAFKKSKQPTSARTNEIKLSNVKKTITRDQSLKENFSIFTVNSPESNSLKVSYISINQEP